MNTNTFPPIKHISDLLPFISGNQQIRVKTEANGMTVVCYMVQDEDTFDGEHAEFARECRGITFDAAGNIAARTLHKFFNVGERESTMPENLPWHKVTRIMDKRDGSMITPVLVNGSVKCKTKKSFDTKEALLADQIMHQIEVIDGVRDQHKLEWVRRMLNAGFTPTFELTSPRFPIVLKYDRDELTLLHIRENSTGRYITSLGEGGKYTHDCPFPIVPNLMLQFSWTMEDAGVPSTYEVRWDLLKEAAETRTGIEGWVIQFENGDMVKLKTKWYCDLHHAVTFTRWRDIARAVVTDTADDLKGAFALTGRSIEPIELVQHTIKVKITNVESAVRAIVQDGVDAGFDAKQMALQWKGHDQFGLIMSMFRGKQIDFMAWYEKHCLDADWSLEVVEVHE